MNLYEIVIVSSGTLDTVYILKILDKFKSKKILLISERNFNHEIFKLANITNLTLMKLNPIYFSYEISFKEYTQIFKLFANFFKIIKIRWSISKTARIYFFNEFYSFCSFLSFKLLKQFKYRFIRSIRFLEVKNFNSEELFQKRFSKKKILKIYLSFKILNFLFNDLNLVYYQLDKNYYKKDYQIDYYKAEGFGFTESINYLKIPPFNYKNSSSKKSKNPLYLFAPVEQTSIYGINLDLTYKKLFKYISTYHNEIDLKIHPSLKESKWISKLASGININFIEADLPAEYFISEYNIVYVNFVSNSIRHYIENNKNTDIKFISLINLIKFEDQFVFNKFNQMYEVVFNNFEKNIQKVIQ